MCVSLIYQIIRRHHKIHRDIHSFFAKNLYDLLGWFSPFVFVFCFGSNFACVWLGRHTSNEYLNEQKTQVELSSLIYRFQIELNVAHTNSIAKNRECFSRFCYLLPFHVYVYEHEINWLKRFCIVNQQKQVTQLTLWIFMCNSICERCFCSWSFQFTIENVRIILEMDMGEVR